MFSVNLVVFNRLFPLAAGDKAQVYEAILSQIDPTVTEEIEGDANPDNLLIHTTAHRALKRLAEIPGQQIWFHFHVNNYIVDFAKLLADKLKGHVSTLATLNQPAFVLVALCGASDDIRTAIKSELAPKLKLLSKIASKGSKLLCDVCPCNSVYLHHDDCIIDSRGQGTSAAT